MNKMFKSNKFIVITLIIICGLLLLNPQLYAEVCLKAVTAWATKVFPLLFPMMVLTRLIISLTDSQTSHLDKLFCKVYNLPNGSFFTFFLSVLAGYPTGAKLIAYKAKNERLNSHQIASLHSLCSISGPMFMIGSVGVGILSSWQSGVIVFVSNVIAVLINGLIFRNKEKQTYISTPIISSEKNVFSNSVYEATISVLLICSYMILSFVFVAMLKQIHLQDLLIKAIYCIVPNIHTQQIVEAIFSGCIEMTHGILQIAGSNLSLSTKTIVSSCLVSFGGLSVFMQSKTFLGDCDISSKTIFIQKCMQTSLCFVVSFCLCRILL